MTRQRKIIHPSKEDVQNLFSKLSDSANSGYKFEEDVKESTLVEEERLESQLRPYKGNQAWPGRHYSLIGNSFNLEIRIADSLRNSKRSACIAMVLEKGKENRKCLSIEDAFSYEGFVECLSRFEYDWLSKQPPSTLIGPAYNHLGELLPNSFAVWRRDSAFYKAKEKRLAVFQR